MGADNSLVAGMWPQRKDNKIESVLIIIIKDFQRAMRFCESKVVLAGACANPIAPMHQGRELAALHLGRHNADDNYPAIFLRFHVRVESVIVGAIPKTISVTRA